jgi:hypothetical protein
LQDPSRAPNRLILSRRTAKEKGEPHEPGKRVLRKYALGTFAPSNFQPSDMRDLADDPEHLFTRAEIWGITLLVVGAVLALIGIGAAEGLLMR